MALIKCIECGNDISDKADVCPHCGLRVEESLKKYEEADQFQNISPQVSEDKANEIEARVKIIAFVLIMFATTIFLFLSDRSEPTTTNTIEKVVSPMDEAFIGDEHWVLRETIKQDMHNPDSYEFVSGRRWQNDGKYFTEIYFRGTNGFGAVVTNNVVAELDSNGNIISISR